MKLANKISLLFLIISLLCILIALGLVYQSSKKNLSASINNNLQSIVHDRTKHIETYLRMMKASVVQASRSVVLPNALKTATEDPGYKDALANAEKLLVSKKIADASVYEYMLLDASGRVVAATDPVSVGEDPSLDDYFLGAQKTVYIKDLHFSETKKQILMAISVPLFDGSEGAFLGVLVARVAPDDLYAIVTDRTGLGKTGEIYIVNSGNYMVTPCFFEEDAVLKEKVETDHVRDARNETDPKSTAYRDGQISLSFNCRGQQVLGAHDYIPSMRWAVIAEISAKEAFAPLDKLRFSFLLVLVLAGALSWVLGQIIARFITGPIQRLNQGTEIIGRGNLDYKVGITTQDEVGDLSRAFDIMTANLKKTTASVVLLKSEIEERKKVESALAESERRFHDIFYSAKDALLLIDDGKFIDANEATAKMLGFANREEFLMVHPSKLSPSVQPDGRASFEKADEMMRLAFEQGFHQFEWTHRRANGQDFSVLVSLTPVTIKGKQVLYCVWIDLTNKRLDEQRFAEVQARLKEQAGALAAALDESRKSHEILSSMLDDNNQMRLQFEQTARKLEMILSSTGEGVFGLDIHGKHTFVNPQALRMLGYDEEELVGQDSHSLYHHTYPDGRPYPLSECPNSLTLQDGVVRHGEDHYWRKDGTVFVVEFSTAPLVEDGKTSGLVVSFRDITERNRAQDALRQSEERTRSITDSAQDAIIMMDPAGKITFWNPAAERILGYSVEEAIGRDLHQFITPERFRAAHAAAFPEFLRTGKGGAVGKTLELAAIRKDGVEIPISISLSSVKREDGWHAVGIISDISERVRSREELLKLTRAIEQSPATVVITNLKGEIEYANPKFCQLTGYSLPEVLGQNPRVLKSGEMSAEGYAELWKKISKGEEWRGEFHNKKKNGELYWESATISPIKDSKGQTTHYLAVKEDITSLKEAEAAMNKLRLQLVQSDRLSTLGEMATGMAHEINQPLGAIALVVTSFKKYIEKKVLTEDRLADGIRDIEASIKRMTNTINHIRIYARQETLEFDRIDLPHTVDSALTLLGEQLRIHGIELEKTIEPDLPQIKGEPHQLEQVWINLISNARDAMDEKQKLIEQGQLSIPGYQKTLRITVTHEKESNMVLLSFSDNGMGITDEQRKKIFDPFFTTKEVGKGTGLGLSISFGIIEKHNGRIEVAGKRGEGATFNIYLPVDA